VTGDERVTQSWHDLVKASSIDGELHEGIAAALHAVELELPEIVGSPGLADALQASVGLTAELFVAMLDSGLPLSEAEPPPATVAYARELAHLGIPVLSLLRANRVAHVAIWRWFMERARTVFADPAEMAIVIEEFTAASFAFTDAITDRISTEYQTARERWVRSAAAIRTEIIGELLSGASVDPRAASAALRYELGRHHVAFVAWRDSPDLAATADAGLEAVAAEIAGALGVDRPLLSPVGQGTLAAWLGSHSPLAPEAIASLGVPDWVSVAIGSPGADVAGFRRSHQQALRAREIALLCGRTGVTQYRDIALLAIATSDLERAREFVEAELGTLASTDDWTRRLAATLRVYLEELGSPRRAGHRLGIHENTVASRVRAAEEQLGAPWDGRVPQLLLALKLLDVVKPQPAQG
jgi:DNA-binding PucR family transcriptional regulator